MRAVIQRVTRASVTVDGKTVGSIGPGLLILLGIGINDTGDNNARRASVESNLGNTDLSNA